MKWALIILNLSAFVFLVVLGNMTTVSQRSQASTLYHELKSQNVLVERSDPDVERRLRTMAAGNSSRFLAQLAAGVCLVNAVAIGFLWRRSKI